MYLLLLLCAIIHGVLEHHLHPILEEFQSLWSKVEYSLHTQVSRFRIERALSPISHQVIEAY